MNEKYVIGIDAGGTKVAYGLFDQNGAILDRVQHPSDIDADGPAFADAMIESVRAFVSKNGLTMSSLLGIGVCMPSFILYEKGYIFLTSALPKIKDFPMRDYLSERLEARIVLDNDSNAAALAEYRHGAGRGEKHMIYVSASTGLGSGIIIDGKLFQGSYGWAGECGHMLATPGEGVMCGCENTGCYMSYSSGRFFKPHVELKLEAGMKSSLSPDTVNGIELLKAFNAGDELAKDLLEQVARNMAICVFNVYQMLNIRTFVFGGGLVNFGDALFGPMKRIFDSYNHIPLPVYFKMAELTKDFGIIGAAEFVRAL